MSEEVQENDGTWSGLKKTIIGVVTTAVMGVGTWGVTQITGGDKEEAAPVQQAAPVINITNSNQQAAASGGKTVIIKEKETVKEKPVPAKPKKEADEFKEKPAAW